MRIVIIDSCATSSALAIEVAGTFELDEMHALLRVHAPTGGYLS